MFQVGDRVTCKLPEEAYYSNYGGRPEMVFRPGMVGVIAAIMPKVRLTKLDARHDNKPYFLVVDYHCFITNKTQRVGLDYCNAKKIE